MVAKKIKPYGVVVFFFFFVWIHWSVVVFFFYTCGVVVLSKQLALFFNITL